MATLGLGAPQAAPAPASGGTFAPQWWQGGGGGGGGNGWIGVPQATPWPSSQGGSLTDNPIPFTTPAAGGNLQSLTTAIYGKDAGWLDVPTAIYTQDQQLAQQQLTEYESGKLPPGEQLAIDTAFNTGTGTLTGQLAAEGLDPATSSQYSGGVATLAQQKSIATQQALDKLLQQYFQSQGMAMQASQMVMQYNEFQQQLAFEYFQLSVQAEEFQQQLQQSEQQAKKGQMGQLAGSVGGLFGGGKGGAIVIMAKLWELLSPHFSNVVGI